MKDPTGLIITTEDELKKHIINHYKNVLRNRTINDDLKEHKKDKDELCEMRLNQTKLIKKTKILKVLKGLKKKKSKTQISLQTRYLTRQLQEKTL